MFLDIVFLACAVIFCATTFARDDVLAQVGLSPQKVHNILGVASIAAFFASLVALRVDWKGRSALHRDATQKLTDALALFRELRGVDGKWPPDRAVELNGAYWQAMNNVIKVPEGQFVYLKARHLQKVQLSKMLDTAAGCPVFVLRLVLLWRSMRRTLGKTATNSKEAPHGADREHAEEPDEGR